MENSPLLESLSIEARTNELSVNIVLHTLLEGKQVLVFNNSKSRSEATAEKIAKAITDVQDKEQLEQLSKRVLHALASPTKQCRRLAKCVEKGVAFHHSGLTGKQRTLIEDAFKKGLIKVISSTPTLAAGLNLPAYKVLINDYKRYSSRGFNDIPVLEFHQMAGRAGRPGKENLGKSVVLVKDQQELEHVVPKYIFGESEEILSKLAVEPTLKMYVLSLVAMDMVNTKQEIKDFFRETLYAHQFQDEEGLLHNILRILEVLKEYDFVLQEDEYYLATPLGKKVSELYLNPDTAHYFVEHLDKFLERFSKDNISRFDIYALIFFIGNAQEMKPFFSVSKLEEEHYVSRAEEISDTLVVEFNPFEMDYVDFLRAIKLSDVMSDWINEAPEDYLNEKFKITPGELHYKLETMDWLLYCLEEIALMKKNFFFRTFLNKLRLRFKAGVKEELLPLISLKGIGRSRARKLYNSGLKKIIDLKRAEFATISRLLGDALAIKIKEQIQENLSERSFEERPHELSMREVSDEEVETLLESVESYEKEVKEKNRKLSQFF